MMWTHFLKRHKGGGLMANDVLIITGQSLIRFWVTLESVENWRWWGYWRGWRTGANRRKRNWFRRISLISFLSGSLMRKVLLPHSLLYGHQSHQIYLAIIKVSHFFDITRTTRRTSDTIWSINAVEDPYLRRWIWRPRPGVPNLES